MIALQGSKTRSQLKINAVFRTGSVLELETFVDSIDISDRQGREVVLQVSTDIRSNRTFYTDSNGLEMQKRVKDFRPTWKYEVH